MAEFNADKLAHSVALKAMKEISITNMLEAIKTDICDDYCKYPSMQPPEGLGDDWLIESDFSPCLDCPLNRL